MSAVLQRNARHGAEQRNYTPRRIGELLAAIACYWLVIVGGYALLTGNAAPLLVSCVMTFALLYLARTRR